MRTGQAGFYLAVDVLHLVCRLGSHVIHGVTEGQ